MMPTTISIHRGRLNPERVEAGYYQLGSEGYGKVVGPIPCPHYRGNCLGDGCVQWCPIPSGPFARDGYCLKRRGGEPLHKAECLRKARQYERAAANPHDVLNHVYDLVKAAQWRKAAESAPERRSPPA